MRGIARWIRGIEPDMTGTARDADEERRLDGAVGDLAYARVGRRTGLPDHRSRKALPRSEIAVELFPARAIESRIGKLAKSENTHRRSELQIARRLPLIDSAGFRVHIVREQ